MGVQKKLLVLLLWACTLTAAAQTKRPVAAGQSADYVWPAEKATQWYKNYRWISGANYLPATAINQLEMWQAETFDPATIDRELSWAEAIGFSTMRVFLHSLVWKNDAPGFKKRIDQYLSIASRHNINTIFVFFDDCWNKEPKAGKQPEPKPGVHNSGWMQDPGHTATFDSSGWPVLQQYVTDVLTSFKNDKRILLWDLYNEPGNSGKNDTSLRLLKNVVRWARAVNPDQPITIGLWRWESENLNSYQLNHSDVVTYHDYEDAPWHKRVIELLKASGRPLICTEYMARTRNSRFHNIMPLLKEKEVGAINWGFVAGKSNTIYQWDTPIPSGAQPDEWFHDIFFADGTPYRHDEINLIKKLNGMGR